MASDWALQHLYHTIVNVKDINDSIAFYEMMGFKVISDRRDAVWPKGSAISFGIDDPARGRAALMVLKDDPDGPMMDLIEWVEPKADFPEPGPRRVPRVIAFRTRNVRQMHKELKAKGVKFTTEEPTSIPQAGIVACACAYDPNGHILEMIELEPGLRHSRIRETFTPSDKL